MDKGWTKDEEIHLLIKGHVHNIMQNTITRFLSLATNRYPAKVNNHDLMRAAPDPITNRMTNNKTSWFILSIYKLNNNTTSNIVMPSHYKTILK